MSPSAAPLLADALRRALAGAADPSRVPAMQAYMESALPFRGVGAVKRRALLRSCIEQHPLADARAWRTTVLDLWKRARYREERYAAIDLLLHRSRGRKATRG